MKERMKKVTALCLAAALSVGTVLPVHAETVQDAQNAVDQLQQQKDSVQAEKTTVETELKKIAEEMEKTQSKLDAKQAEITEAEENLVQAKVEENTQYQSMKIRIKYMYENGNMEFIEVLADSENISDFLNKTEYISKLSEYDRDKLKEFQKTVKAVEEQEAALQKELRSRSAASKKEPPTVAEKLISKTMTRMENKAVDTIVRGIFNQMKKWF